MTARPGYFIWRLVSKISKAYTSQQLSDLLLKYGVKWVIIKIADGEFPMNQPVTGRDQSGNYIYSPDLLYDYIGTLQSAGIEVYGFAYSYPSKKYSPKSLTANPVKEAAFYSSLIRDLEVQGFIHNDEAEWKQPGLEKEIDALCQVDPLPGTPDNYPIGLCSYRYPNQHKEFNWPRWMRQSQITFHAPQVYWERQHNPAQQLDACYAQYAKMSNKTFVPIGSMYSRGKPGAKGYWSVTVDDIHQFVDHCQVRGWEQYGFWSLDDALAHPEWMEAAKV